MAHQLDLIIVNPLLELTIRLITTGLEDIGTFASQRFTRIHDFFLRHLPRLIEHEISVTRIQIEPDYIDSCPFEVIHICHYFLLYVSIWQSSMRHDFLDLVSCVSVCFSKVVVKSNYEIQKLIADTGLLTALFYFESYFCVKPQVKIITHQKLIFTGVP